MKKFVYFYVLSMLLFSMTLNAGERNLPEDCNAQSIKVSFNGDSIKAYYLLLDSRSEEERLENARSKKLDGSIIVFFHGHAQRADNAFQMTSLLSLKSKSGITIVPVCDTPFGNDSNWRADRGKDVILMEVVRYVLRLNEIYIDGYNSLTDMKVVIDNTEMNPDVNVKNKIAAKLTVSGWSHGAILARRMARAYPDATIGLAQMCPAGFEKWGSRSCIGPARVAANFSLESACISFGVFRGEAGKIFGSSWGITKGIFGDTFRSCGSCVSGNFHLCKLFRGYDDLQDVSIYQDDSNFPISSIKNITVMFGAEDSIFEWENVGFSGIDAAKQKEVEAFWTRYYPGAVAGGANLTVKVLPGNHLAPAIYFREYAEAALAGTGEMRE